MNALASEARGSRADTWDVLTLEEESALSSIRGIVVGLRSPVAGAQIADVERALIAAGGVPIRGRAIPGINVFALRGACFSIAPFPENAGLIEVNFIRDSR